MSRRRIRSRWQSDFGQFVLGYAKGLRSTHGQLIGGPTLLAEHLGVHASAVYHWIDGSTSPRPTYAAAIRQLAAERGTNLTLDQIYDHSRQFRSGRRLESTSEVLETRERRRRPPADVQAFPSNPERRASIARVLRELGK